MGAVSRGAEPGLLTGVRVLDFATVGPAARSSRWLSDWGADVVKLGAVPRAGGVQINPPHYAYAGHRGMRRALLDLKHDQGREAFLALATTADVVIESFRPGVVDRLGVGYDDVRSVNPRIVYCSTSGYGQTGPRSRWAGHDLNYLAAGGFLDCTQPRSDGGPPIPGATIADSAGGGMHAVMAILAALVSRATTGEGTFLDVSVADGVLAFMALYGDEYLATGTIPAPGHNILTGRYACYDLYECSDGGWVSVGAIEPHFYTNLCVALGCEQWAERQMDDEVQSQIRADFAASFATRTRDDWAGTLGPADCCVAPVLSIPEVTDDEQFLARGAVVDALHPTEGAFRQIGPLLAGQVAPVGPVPVPDWGQTQTAELLAEAGLDATKITQLIDAGAVA